MLVMICSLKFSIGHLSLMNGLFKLFEYLDCDTVFYLDVQYNKFFSKNEKLIENDLSTAIEKKPEFVIFVNLDITNKKIMKTFKEAGSKIAYIYHEPYPGLKTLMTEGNNFIKCAGAAVLNEKYSRLPDLLIFPSKTALDMYGKFHSNCDNCVIFPLVYEDELSELMDKTKREKEYCSFLAGFLDSHGAHNFVEFIKYAYESHSSIKFMIATRSSIDEVLKDKVIQAMIDKQILIIHAGRNMTTEEVNQYYQQSFCVWNLYKNCTQSAVAAHAFMFGTPILASDLPGFRECLIDGYNGYYAKRDDYCGILEKVEYLYHNQERFYDNTRKTFLDLYDCKNTYNVERMKNIIKRVTAK